MTWRGLRAQLTHGAMTSLEWATLWRLSEGTPRWAPTTGDPIIRFSNSWLDRIPGSLSATTALIERGMVRMAPLNRNGPVVDSSFPDARALILTPHGRRALRSAVAAPHRPPPRAEEGTVPGWYERERAGEWMLVEERYRTLWLLQQDGPAVLRRDAAPTDRLDPMSDEYKEHRLAGWSRSLIDVSAFIERGYAEERDGVVIITPAGRETLESRLDLTAWYEAQRRVHKTHQIYPATREEYELHQVGPRHGCYICTCGWVLIYADPWSRQWADEFPAMGHFTHLIEIEILAVVREREARR